MVAALFALSHYRTEGAARTESRLMLMLSANIIAELVALVFAWIWVRRIRGATAADLGWTPQRFFPDVGLGLIVFFAIFIPIQMILYGAKLLLPPNIAPDPVPLFFLALVLGSCYYSTRRVVPVVAIHMAVNGYAFCLILWFLLQSVPLT
jgi:hypothetical protein